MCQFHNKKKTEVKLFTAVKTIEIERLFVSEVQVITRIHV